MTQIRSNFSMRKPLGPATTVTSLVFSHPPPHVEPITSGCAKAKASAVISPHVSRIPSAALMSNSGV